MNWTVEIQRSAEKELGALAPIVQRRIARALSMLEANPYPSGVKKLQNRDGYRIRVGDYRILYVADATRHWIRITAIGHRRDVYHH